MPEDQRQPGSASQAAASNKMNDFVAADVKLAQAIGDFGKRATDLGLTPEWTKIRERHLQQVPPADSSLPVPSPTADLGTRFAHADLQLGRAIHQFRRASADIGLVPDWTTVWNRCLHDPTPSSSQDASIAQAVPALSHSQPLPEPPQTVSRPESVAGPSYGLPNRRIPSNLRTPSDTNFLSRPTSSHIQNTGLPSTQASNLNWGCDDGPRSRKSGRPLVAPTCIAAGMYSSINPPDAPRPTAAQPSAPRQLPNLSSGASSSTLRRPPAHSDPTPDRNGASGEHRRTPNLVRSSFPRTPILMRPGEGLPRPPILCRRQTGTSNSTSAASGAQVAEPMSGATGSSGSNGSASCQTQTPGVNSTHNPGPRVASSVSVPRCDSCHAITRGFRRRSRNHPDDLYCFECYELESEVNGDYGESTFSDLSDLTDLSASQVSDVFSEDSQDLDSEPGLRPLHPSTSLAGVFSDDTDTPDSEPDVPSSDDEGSRLAQPEPVSPPTSPENSNNVVVRKTEDDSAGPSSEIRNAPVVRKKEEEDSDGETALLRQTKRARLSEANEA